MGRLGNIDLAIITFIIIVFVIVIVMRLAKNGSYDKAPISADILNLYGLSLDQVIYELKLNLATPNPKDISMMLDVNHQYRVRADQQKLILENIQNLQTINAEYINLKAQEILSNDTLEFLIQDKQSSFRNILEIKAAKHDLELQKLKSAKEFELLKFEVDKANLRGIIADVDSKEADLDIKKRNALLSYEKKQQDLKIELANNGIELNKKAVNIDFEKAKVDFIRKIVNEFNINDMKEAFQTYLIATIVSPNNSNYQDFDKQQIINSFLKQQIEEDIKSKQHDNDMKRQKVEQEKTVAEDMKYKSETKRKDFEI